MEPTMYEFTVSRGYEKEQIKITKEELGIIMAKPLAE